jgi:hypothetical protein
METRRPAAHSRAGQWRLFTVANVAASILSQTSITSLDLPLQIIIKTIRGLYRQIKTLLDGRTVLSLIGSIICKRKNSYRSPSRTPKDPLWADRPARKFDR